MIFTHIVPILLVAAVSSQALYIPDALYAREFEEANEFAERGLDHLNVVRDLASNNEVTVLTARDFVALDLRSDDVLSQILVTRARSPSPGPYECKSKADCQKHIEYADHQIQEATAAVARWQRALSAAARGSAAARNAGNNLHTARESLAGWRENKEDYQRMKSHFAS
jgi:hypothetical protein